MPDAAPLRLALLDRAHLHALHDPLTHHEQVDVRWRDPGVAAAELASGEHDAALLPVLVVFALADTRLVPGIGVALVADSSAPCDTPEHAALAQALGADGPVRLWGAWCANHTGTPPLPLPLYVWACRRRAPYPRLRRVLTQAWHSAQATGAPPGLRYALGSAEADGLRRLHALTREAGLPINDAPPPFC